MVTMNVQAAAVEDDPVARCIDGMEQQFSNYTIPEDVETMIKVIRMKHPNGSLTDLMCTTDGNKVLDFIEGLPIGCREHIQTVTQSNQRVPCFALYARNFSNPMRSKFIEQLRQYKHLDDIEGSSIACMIKSSK